MLSMCTPFATSLPIASTNVWRAISTLEASKLHLDITHINARFIGHVALFDQTCGGPRLLRCQLPDPVGRLYVADCSNDLVPLIKQLTNEFKPNTSGCADHHPRRRRHDGRAEGGRLNGTTTLLRFRCDRVCCGISGHLWLSLQRPRQSRKSACKGQG